MSTTFANFLKIFFGGGTPSTLPEKKGSWYVGLLVCPEFWGSFVRFTMYVLAGTRMAIGGVAQGLPRAWPRKTGSPYDNRYGSWVVGYKLLELVERFVGLFCFR